MTARLDYRSDTGLMAGCSTLGAWRLFQRWRRLSSETSCLLTTVPSTPAQSRWCSTKCTVYSRCDNFGLTISTKKTEVMYQPAPGKPYQESHITVKGQTYRQLTTSPIWVVHPIEWCTSMLKSTTGWLRPAAPSEAYVRMSGSGGISASLLSWRSILQWYRPRSFTPARPGLSTAETPSSSTISTWAASAEFSTLDSRTTFRIQRA